MAGWKNMDFRSKKAKAEGTTAFVPRPQVAREMVSGLASWCMYLAIRDHAKLKDTRQYKLIDEMGIGASTFARMRNCKPIAQTTALKIVTFLGTSVRAVVSKYQLEKK